MKKYIKFLIFFVIALLLGLLIFVFYQYKANSSKEYLHITTVSYRNGTNYDDGVSMVTYVYDIKRNEMRQLADIPVIAEYPISYYDYKNNKLYYSSSEEGEGYDNLYVYHIKNKTSTRLTDGKFLFNDFLMIDGDLVCNVAPEYCTVTQPAIYNIKENTFRYLNKEDDDTWCFSLSYNKLYNKLVSLTCSDSEMRTREVCDVTHIRPKTIYHMNPDFSEYEPVYYTKEFEIRSTRQLDKNRIMLAVDPTMGSGSPRKLKILDINTKELSDLEVPELKDIQSFYPRDNGEGVFILGKDHDNIYSIYYLDLMESKLTNLFDTTQHRPDYCGIVDFIYSDN